MKVTKIDNQITTGIPDYYSAYLTWISHYKSTGKNNSKINAYHYARVAEEFGQALIEDDTTLEVYVENR